MLGFTEKNRFMWREVASESRGGMLKSEDRYNWTLQDAWVYIGSLRSWNMGRLVLRGEGLEPCAQQLCKMHWCKKENGVCEKKKCLDHFA